MKVSVIGPGAVGMLLGALLQAGGHDVSFRGRGARAGIPRRIRVVLPGGWLTCDTARWPRPQESAGSPDAVLVTLGRHHLHAARRPDFLPLVGKGQGPVAFFNTGGPDMNRLEVPRDRQRLCLSLLAAGKLQEGDVELAPGKSVLVHEKSAILDECFACLPRQGIQVTPVADAQPLANSLLLYQLLALPVAMCNATLDGFLAWPEGRELAASILGEGFTTVERAGLPVASLPVMDPRELMSRLERKPGLFAGGAVLPDRSYNTVLQSYLGGRPTEAAHINRKIVEIASSAGLRLTWNWRLLQKASRISGPGFYRDPAELLRSLA